MINTKEYLLQVVPNRLLPPHAKPSEFAQLEKKAKFVQDHSLIIKITRIVFLILSGIAVVAALGQPIALGISLGSAGIIGIILTEFIFSQFAQFGLLARPMSNHAYKPAQCPGGRLHYQGNIPILTLQSDDPYIAGKAHGYLAAEQILKLNERVRNEGGLPDHATVPKVLEQIASQLPKEFLKEMQGLADGVNKWIDEQYWFNKYPKVSFNEVLLNHLMPDQLYFNLGAQEQACNIACTVAIVKDKNVGPIFGRNMDWRSFGLAGTYSLAINRKYSNGKPATVEIGVPGMIGTLTGMNSHGLSVAMNVCAAGISLPTGTPAALYNRMVLENCKTVAETEDFVKHNHPLGSYHLSVADAERAQSYHFYQGVGQTRVTRKLEGDKPLITTNCSYRDSKTQHTHMHSSYERDRILNDLFSDARAKIRPEALNLEAIVAHGLTLPYVNNLITTHTVQMIPGQKRIKAAFDNAFSASLPLQEIDTSSLF